MSLTARNGFDQECVQLPASTVEKPEALAMVRAWVCELCLSPMPDNAANNRRNKSASDFCVRVDLHCYVKILALPITHKLFEMYQTHFHSRHAKNYLISHMAG